MPNPSRISAGALFEHSLKTGRVCLDGDAIALDHSLSKIEFSVQIEQNCVLKASISIAYGQIAELICIVDGKQSALVILNEQSREQADYTLATLAPGAHRVTLVKNTQARNGGINLYSLVFDGKIDSAPAPAPTKIQIIGDSISTGAGAVPTDREEVMCDDASASYGALLGASLPAEVSVFAVSGWGIACGGMDEVALIPRIYGKQNAFRDPERELVEDHAPDVVIIALGTNDYRFANEGRTDFFIEKAKDFLSSARDRYPQARILWIYGQMLNQYDAQLEAMVRSFGDPNMDYLTVPKNVSGGFGHPDAQGHRQYADLIRRWIEGK